MDLEDGTNFNSQDFTKAHRVNYIVIDQALIDVAKAAMTYETP